MLEITATVRDMEYQIGARTWRYTFELPPQTDYSAWFIDKVTQHMNFLVEGSSASADIQPGFIRNVKYKGKKFFLVVDNVSETQNANAKYFSTMLEQQAQLKVWSINAELPPEAPTETRPTGNLRPSVLTGLHTNWFPSPKFQAFITTKTGKLISSDKECKAAFKELFNITSCKDLTEEAFEPLRTEFNKYLNLKPLNGG